MLMFLGSFRPSHPSTISLTANRLTLLFFFAILSLPHDCLIDNFAYLSYLHEPCRREVETAPLILSDYYDYLSYQHPTFEKSSFENPNHEKRSERTVEIPVDNRHNNVIT
jgi:hypothetical protein